MAEPISTGAALGAFAGFAGGLVSDRQRTKDHKRQLAHNAYWNSNKYQHTVRDLQSAGLNPALAYRQGASAQTSASAPSRENIGSAAATSAKETALLSAQIRNVDSSTLLNEAKAATEAKNPARVEEQTRHEKEKATRQLLDNQEIQALRNSTGQPITKANIMDLIFHEASPLYNHLIGTPVRELPGAVERSIKENPKESRKFLEWLKTAGKYAKRTWDNRPSSYAATGARDLYDYFAK